jgi:predicted secreted protein
MEIVSAIAIYVIFWWIIFFCMLPVGVRTPADDGGQVEEGHATSAPVLPRLGWKIAWTTGISAVLFGLFWLNLQLGWIGLDWFPGPGPTHH